MPPNKAISRPAAKPAGASAARTLGGAVKTLCCWPCESEILLRTIHHRFGATPSSMTSMRSLLFSVLLVGCSVNSDSTQRTGSPLRPSQDVPLGSPERAPRATATSVVLTGTLVGAEGTPLAREQFWLNLHESTGSSSSTRGGVAVETDRRGEFRIDWSALNALSTPCSHQRLLSLTRANRPDAEAVIDVARSFDPGVHYVGELVVAEPWDACAVRHLTDDRLFQVLENARNRSEQQRDTCLRECARRGGAVVINYLAGQLPRRSEVSVWRTAQCRAERLRDPVDLDLPELQASGELACELGKLPLVRLRLTNRDPKGRSWECRQSAPSERDTGLAVDVLAGPDRGYELIPGAESGMTWHGTTDTLVPGQSTTLDIQLGNYVDLRQPGTYRLRLAFREDAFQVVDEKNNTLMPGLLYLYTRAFTLSVGPSRPVQQGHAAGRPQAAGG